MSILKKRIIKTKDNKKIEIRTFKREDIPQIVALFNMVFGEQGALLRTLEIFKWRYINCTDFDEDGIIVAEKKGKIVSSAVITFKKIKISNKEYFVGAIDDVMTHSSVRKKGLAKAILQELIKYGKSKGTDGLLLYTGVDSIAYRFYKKLGFEDVNHYTSLVKVTNSRKILKVGDFKTKLFALWIILSKYIKKTPKIHVKGHLELKELKTEEELKDALILFNEYNKQFVGFKELDWNRWLWMTKTIEDTTETRVFGVKTSQCKSLDAIALVTRHKGTFFHHTLNYGLLKIAYTTETALRYLLGKLLDKIHLQMNIDFLLFSLPILEGKNDLLETLKAYNFVDFGKLANSYTCLMMLFFNKEFKETVNKNKSKAWYIFMEHKLGRP